MSSAATWVRWLAVIAVWVVPAVGTAASQGSPSTSDKQEQKVDVHEAKNQKERPTLKDEGDGPRFKAEEFIEEKNFESVKKQDEAIVRLKDLLETTPKGDSERAEILFNLSEMYWEKSKYYEKSAFQKQDQCYALEDAGRTEKHKQCKRRMDDMLAESNRLREEAVSLYREIIQTYPNFDRMDKILFYLGTNLSEADKHDQALKVYRKFLSNFPNSEYAPNVLLSIGEYYFQQEDNAERALQFYKKVQEFPDSSVYSYARYKAAWCYYNLEQKQKAMDTFIEVVEYARAHPEQPNAKALVDQARKDIVMTYADIGSPSNAMGFFREITDGENQQKQIYDMAERLAILYSDRANYGYSNKMYRTLINKRQRSVKTIDYQYEIVRNYTSENPYSESSLKEIIKLMKLVQYAKDGKFEDVNEKKLKNVNERVSQLARQWATRYHREAQVTKNDSLYKRAFYLYNEFRKTFPDSKHEYEMTFFNAELLYHLEKWERAGKLYQSVIDMKPDGKYTEDSAHAAVLAYMEVVKTSEERADIESPLKFKEGGQTEDVQQNEGDESTVPEKKEITDKRKRLMRACKDYIEYVSDGEHIVDVKYTMARTYYEHNHLEEAVEMFENIAFNHSDHRLAEVAANLHLDALNLMNDFEGLSKAVTKYREKQPIQDEEFRSDLATLDEAIKFKLCREHEKKEQWVETASCYVNFSRDFGDSKYLDKALYNAALAFEREKELGKAIKVRLILLQERPDSELAPESLYNIGGNYHALAVYSRAANYYEKFVDAFPDHEEKARKALSNASNFRYGLGQYDKAIEDYEKYLEMFGDDEENLERASEVSFKIAEIYEQQGKPEEALEQYKRYIDQWGERGPVGPLLQAHVEIGMHHWDNGDRDRALDRFQTTLDRYNQLSKEKKMELTDGRDAAARAKFMTGEDVYEEMAAIQIESSDSEELKKRVQEKMKVAEEAEKIYNEVITFQRPDWAIAALFKIGAQYHNFAETIRDSPTPDGLTYNQKEMYKGLLEDRASTIERKAVAFYEKALETAKNQSWFNEYSRKAEVRLADLRPEKYGSPSEIRAEPTNLDDGFQRSAFIQKLEERGRMEQLEVGDDSESDDGGESVEKEGTDESEEGGETAEETTEQGTSGPSASLDVVAPVQAGDRGDQTGRSINRTEHRGMHGGQS